MSKEQIVNDIYKAYGTDSGILFGIKEREIVAAIVEFTLRRIDPEIEIYRQKLIDVQFLLDHNGFTEAAKSIDKTLEYEITHSL